MNNAFECNAIHSIQTDYGAEFQSEQLLSLVDYLFGYVQFQNTCKTLTSDEIDTNRCEFLLYH